MQIRLIVKSRINKPADRAFLLPEKWLNDFIFEQIGGDPVTTRYHHRYRDNKPDHMKRCNFFVLALCMSPGLLMAADVSAPDDLSLFENNYTHIQFGRIKSNQYDFDSRVLKAEVDHSASFLMKAFESVKPVKQVSFKWRSDGLPDVKDAMHEKQKAGDDAVVKLGLLLKSDNEIDNPLLPKWMRQVKSLLNYPSENMIYLVAGSRHVAGEQWPNPYNRRVTMVAMSSANIDSKLESRIDGEFEEGWQQASYRFSEAVEVVAIWLMADGDNTGSSFTSYVKDINLVPAKPSAIDVRKEKARVQQ